MTDKMVSFLNLEITVLTLTLVVICARLFGLAWHLRSDKPQSPGYLFLHRQPFGLAALIIVTYFISNDIGLVAIIDNVGLNPDSGVFRGIRHSVDLLRVFLTIWLVVKEEKLIYSWIEDSERIAAKLKMILLTIKNSLRLTIFALLLPFLIPRFEFFPRMEGIVNVGLTLLIIWSLAWTANQGVEAAERIYVNSPTELNLTDYYGRSLVTRSRIFSKITSFIILIIAIAASCLIFESVRAVGASILASAGILTGVIGLAANKIIGNFLVGLQIAMTQPIKINDAISVEGEFGIIEDISLNYVVVKIWDLRRLILPINYFIEKPFQNYSRNSTDIISQIVLFADYTLPVAELRQFFHEQVAASRYWDGNTVVLQVTDIQDRIIKLRGIASTRNPSDSWSLKCEILEKMITFIAEKYPDSLPKVRYEKLSGHEVLS